MKTTTCQHLLPAIAALVAVLVCPAARLTAQAVPSSNERDAGKKEEAIQLSIFTVTGDKDEGYRSTQTISGSRTVEELKDIANSISIMNRELIDDLGVTTMEELSAFGITGESAPTATGETTGSSVFRGIVNPWQLRDGAIWYVVPDTFNVERVELLRGPNAFLYGEAAPGGSKNQLTKRARGTNSNQLRVGVGSFNLIRAELDVNRRVNHKLSVRFNAVAQNVDSYINHVGRKFDGLAITARYQPFKNTIVNVAYERGTEKSVRGKVTLRNRFDNTDFNGATSATTAANAGRTYFPALGRTFDLAGTRVSAGRNQPVTDASIKPAELNLVGPSADNISRTQAVHLGIEQHIGNLNLELTINLGHSRRPFHQVAGTKANGLYRDVMATLPDGTPNPYLNNYYTEYYTQLRLHDNAVRDIRLAAVYDLDLSFMKQRILATAQQHQDNPMARVFGEFVDPASPNFKGTLVNADTLAAHTTNNSVMTQNRFYRRLYVTDGDSAALTTWTTQPGTVLRHDVSANSGNAGMFSERRFYSPTYGIGSSGSYWNGRVRSMVGWRHDVFDMHIRRVFYNAATDTEYNVPERPTEYTYAELSAWNLGGVFHATKWLSGFYNWAQSYRISSGEGSETLIPGTKQGLATGDGFETGLRWSFLGGKLVSNWTLYETLMFRDRSGLPSIPNAVRDELEAIFVSEINRGGRDTQTLMTAGLEFETVGNITPNWIVSWNFASNRVERTDTLVALRAFAAAARAKNAPTPETDAFLATVVEGTPRPGFTKRSTNLITRYRFSEGPFRGFMIGGSFQYRSKTFLGNFDAGRDGFAEEAWWPGYSLWNLMSSYDTKIYNRSVRFSLNVDNLLDKTYYRSTSLTGATYNAGRTFKLYSTLRF